jgi:hypothetical protein
VDRNIVKRFVDMNAQVAPHAGARIETPDRRRPNPGPWPSAPPEILEPRRRQFGVPHSVLDVVVAEIGLQGAGVVALAAGMAQHVQVELERHSGFDAGPFHHPREPGGRERTRAL